MATLFLHSHLITITSLPPLMLFNDPLNCVFCLLPLAKRRNLSLACARCFPLPWHCSFLLPVFYPCSLDWLWRQYCCVPRDLGQQGFLAHRLCGLSHCFSSSPSLSFPMHLRKRKRKSCSFSELQNPQDIKIPPTAGLCQPLFLIRLCVCAFPKHVAFRISCCINFPRKRTSEFKVQHRLLLPFVNIESAFHKTEENIFQMMFPQNFFKKSNHYQTMYISPLFLCFFLAFFLKKTPFNQSMNLKSIFWLETCIITPESPHLNAEFCC